MANTLVSFPQGGQTMDIAAGGRITGGVFLAPEHTSTGGAQAAVNHGLGVTPSVVLIIPTDTSATMTPGDYAVSYVATDTTITVTATADLVYVVYAWA